MSSNKAADPSTSERSDWKHAWDVMSRLAAVRGSTLQEIDKARPQLAAATSVFQVDARRAAAPTSRQFAEIERTAAAFAPELRPLPPIAPDQLVRDIAEIEKAAAALRAQEPNLEPGHPDDATFTAPNRSGSIWILLATIWISAALVVSGALGALALLFG